MSEKLASAEIAESRERFEKFFNRQELGHQLISNVRKTACWETYQQAERDTRERIAKLGRSLLDLVLDATLRDLSQKKNILDTFERLIREGKG